MSFKAYFLRIRNEDELKDLKKFVTKVPAYIEYFAKTYKVIRGFAPEDVVVAITIDRGDLKDSWENEVGLSSKCPKHLRLEACDGHKLSNALTLIDIGKNWYSNILKNEYIGTRPQMVMVKHYPANFIMAVANKMPVFKYGCKKRRKFLTSKLSMLEHYKKIQLNHDPGNYLVELEEVRKDGYVVWHIGS